MNPSEVPFSPLVTTASTSASQASTTSEHPATLHGPPQIHNEVLTQQGGTASAGVVVSDFGRLGMPEFTGADWRGWRYKLELNMKLRGVTDDNRKATALLSLLSVKLLSETIAQLGKKWEELSYKEVASHLDKRFDQSKLVMARRYEFMTRTEAGEGPVQFWRSLREQQSTCEFDQVKDTADFMLAMAFVTGVRDPHLRYLLLKEPELSGAKAEEVALNYVSIREATLAIGAAGSVAQPAIHALDGPKCHACNGVGHVRKECPNERKERAGSSASRRRSKRGRSAKLHNVNMSDPCDDGFPRRLHTVNLHRVGLELGDQHRAPKGSLPSLISVTINERPVVLLLDCGAEISVLSERAWRQLGKPAVRAVSPVESYGTAVPMIGQARVWISFAGRAEMIDIAVAVGMSRDSLFGRDLIHLLQIDMGPFYRPGSVVMPGALTSEVKAGSAGEKQKSSVVARKRLVSPTLRMLQVASPDTQKITVSTVGRSEVPSAYSKNEAGTTSGDFLVVDPQLEAVFAPGCDRLKHAEANLMVAGSKPRLHTPISTTASRTPAAYDRDPRNPVDWAGWAAQMMKVPKSGRMRSAGRGIKDTIESCLKTAVQLHPGLDDLFTDIIGGTRSDVRTGVCREVPMDPEMMAAVAFRSACASLSLLREAMLTGRKGVMVDHNLWLNVGPSLEHLRWLVLAWVQATKSTAVEMADGSRNGTRRTDDVPGTCTAGEGVLRRGNTTTTKMTTFSPDAAAETSLVHLLGSAPLHMWCGGSAVSARGRSEPIYHGSLLNHQQLKTLTGGLGNDCRRPSGDRTTKKDVGSMMLMIQGATDKDSKATRGEVVTSD